MITLGRCGRLSTGIIPLFDAEIAGVEMLRGAARFEAQTSTASKETADDSDDNDDLERSAGSKSALGNTAVANKPAKKRRRKNAHLRNFSNSGMADVSGALKTCFKNIEQMYVAAVAGWLQFFAEVCLTCLPVMEAKLLAQVHERVVRALWLGAHHDAGSLLRGGGAFAGGRGPSGSISCSDGMSTAGMSSAQILEEQWVHAFQKLSPLAGSGASSIIVGGGAAQQNSIACEKLLVKSCSSCLALLSALQSAVPAGNIDSFGGAAASGKQGGVNQVACVGSVLTLGGFAAACMGVSELVSASHSVANVRAAANRLKVAVSEAWPGAVGVCVASGACGSSLSAVVGGNALGVGRAYADQLQNCFRASALTGAAENSARLPAAAGKAAAGSVASAEGDQVGEPKGAVAKLKSRALSPEDEEGEAKKERSESAQELDGEDMTEAQIMRELDDIIRERDLLLRERDTAMKERDAAIKECEQLRLQQTAALQSAAAPSNAQVAAAALMPAAASRPVLAGVSSVASAGVPAVSGSSGASASSASSSSFGGGGVDGGVTAGDTAAESATVVESKEEKPASAALSELLEGAADMDERDGGDSESSELPELCMDGPDE